MSEPPMRLADWDLAFNDADQCPWPGPKPMAEKGEKNHLIGRGNDINNIVSDVVQHQMVVLHGQSGVGKSSMLNVGIVDALIANGLEPILCNDWARTAHSEDDPDAFVASKVPPTERLAGQIDLSGTAELGLIAQLDKAFGDNAVLVLDQFEELIRYQPQHFRRTMEWVQGINRDHKVRVVLSLRSEYLHKLKILDRTVRPFSMARYELEPLVERDVILGIVNSANSTGHLAVAEDCAELLTDKWVAAQSYFEASETSGLLQLQATLYSLHARANHATVEGQQTVESQHVNQMMAASSDNDNLFALGLAEAVGLKLERCVGACSPGSDGSALDPVLIEGTRALVQRAVGHMSSGGYKLVNEEWDLAKKVLERELDILKVDLRDAERLFRVLSCMTGAKTEVTITSDTEPPLDFLSAPRLAIIQAALGAQPVEPEESASLKHLGVDPAPWFSDDSDVSSGPMLGLPPLWILVEELRRFAFAMHWLITASLVRPSSPASDQTMLSLIHDGFTRALEVWVSNADDDPAEALSLLTAARGENYDWRRPESDLYWKVFDGASIGAKSEDGLSHRTITNVRWSNCQVSAHFRRVAFVNCDFRGTRFSECDFRGVVFINCLMDSASFERCFIRGELQPYVQIPDELRDALEIRKELPSFEVPVDEEVVHTLNHYRGTHVATAELISITSGVPLVPWQGVVKNVLKFQPQSGGLIMFGGRLSSLMIRDCTFEEGGSMAFRHTAGSALDVVEQSVGRIEVSSSVIRGMTVTRKVDDGGQRAEPEGFRLEVRDSVLANTWFGGGLTGRADFENSVLWQLVNVSDRSGLEVHTSGLEVHIANCTRFGLVNVAGYTDSPERKDYSPEQEGFGIDGVKEDAWDVLNANSMLMDYRSVPARLELEHRIAALQDD